MLLCVVRVVHAQPDEDEFKPGLIGTYRVGASTQFQQVDPRVAFSASTDDLAPDRPVEVTWRGYLMSQARGRYHFNVHGIGQIKVVLPTPFANC